MPESTEPNATAHREAKSNVVEMSSATTETDQAQNAKMTTESTKTTETTKGSGLWILLLGAMLAISVVLNFIQAQGRSALKVQASEYATALERTVTRLDEETLRANGAEAKIEAIDGSIGTVHERITSLKLALDELSEITAQ